MSTPARPPTTPTSLWPRVAVVTDHALVTQTVCTALREHGVGAQGLDWTRTSAQHPHAQQIVHSRPHAAVLVRDIPFDGNLAAARWLVRQFAGPWVIVGRTHPASLGALLDRGHVAAVLPTDVAPAPLTVVLARVASGTAEPLLGASDARDCWDRLARVHGPLLDRLERLSPRERDVLTMLTAGERPEEIAQVLGTSISTVRTQVKGLRHKLRVRSQLGAVAAYVSVRDEDGEPPLP